jgi:hypothetical protein
MRQAALFQKGANLKREHHGRRTDLERDDKCRIGVEDRIFRVKKLLDVFELGDHVCCRPTGRVPLHLLGVANPKMDSVDGHHHTWKEVRETSAMFASADIADV